MLSPPRWRRRFSRLLAERGLGLKVSLAHDPDAKNLRCLVPLSPEVATYAYTNLIATRPGRRRLVLRALRVGWLARLAAGTLPAAGFAAGAATSRPLFAWLFAATDAGVRSPLAVLSVSWRGSKGSLVAHGFEDGAALPSVVAKVRGSATPAVDDEAAVIRRLGPAARAAGAAVPEPLLVETGQNRAVLFETPVEGRTAAAILGETPALVASVTTRLTTWLRIGISTRARTGNSPRNGSSVPSPDPHALSSRARPVTWNTSIRSVGHSWEQPLPSSRLTTT